MNELTIEQLAYMSVAEIIAEVGEDSVVPPGRHGRLSAAIDRLRMVAAPSEHIALAERVSINMHLLERAVRQKNDAEIAELRESTRALGAKWKAAA